MPNTLDLRTPPSPTISAPSDSPNQQFGMQEEILSWTGKDASSREKTAEWYWVLGIFVVAFVFIGVVFQNFLLSLLAITSGASLALIGSRKPFEVSAAITAEGIIVDGKIHRYEDLKSFWVFFEPPYFKELSLTPKKSLSPHVRIPLGDTNPALVHETLTPFLREVREEEAFADILARKIGL